MNTREMSHDSSLFQDPPRVIPDLKPCPNCQMPSARVKYYPGLMKRRFSVHCKKCGSHLTFRFLTELEAVNAWNQARNREVDMSEIRVIIKKPGEPPVSAQIENTLESLQETVGGYIETVTMSRDVVIICNEEGRIKGLPFNCRVGGHDFVGTIIFAGIEGDEFADLPVKIASWLEDGHRQVMREATP